MKILITGATGFVGKTIVPFLYNKGFTNIALLIRDNNKSQKLFCSLPIILIDINNNWREEVIAYNPDTVLHMATCFTGKCDAESVINIVNSNILLTTLLLESLTHTQCEKFINIGTFTEYSYGAGKIFPNNLYSASKSAVRPIIQFYQTQSKWKWINVIVYSPYGRKNNSKKVIDYMIEAMESPIPIDFTKGEQILDFIHVDDIADFFYVLLHQINNITEDFVEFHLGTGEGHSLREVALILEDIFGKKINANWGGRFYQKLDMMHAIAPIAFNIEKLNWRAKISIQQGLSILKSEYCDK